MMYIDFFESAESDVKESICQTDHHIASIRSSIGGPRDW
jgi:hypothetical protein